MISLQYCIVGNLHGLNNLSRHFCGVKFRPYLYWWWPTKKGLLTVLEATTSIRRINWKERSQHLATKPHLQTITWHTHNCNVTSGGWSTVLQTLHCKVCRQQEYLAWNACAIIIYRSIKNVFDRAWTSDFWWEWENHRQKNLFARRCNCILRIIYYVILYREWL